MRMRTGVYINSKYFRDKNEYLSMISSALSDTCVEFIPLGELHRIPELDMLLVLGGDGTILDVVSECALHGVKILGVNCGHLGFLTDFEDNQISDALKLLSEGKFSTFKRDMLEVSYGNNTYYALNEAVIQRSTTGNAFSNTINLRAEIDGSTVDNFIADGLIVSTPTGSTAYSLSAGGAILTPNLEALIMTPICPHSLHSRPIVFSNKSTVKINQSEKDCALNLIVDGKVMETLSGFEAVTVKKSDRTAEFITVTNNNFFDKLLIKLNIWSK